MIEKDIAVALRMAPFSETSRIVTWMSRSRGRIATLAKGSQRPKSAFLGQYDLFYSCEILYHARPAHDLHILRECTPIAHRAQFRSNWKAMAVASYFAELVLRTCLPEAPNKEVFDLLENALDMAASGRKLDTCLLSFEIKLLRALGHAPQLGACLKCRKPIRDAAAALSAGPQYSAFSFERGGVLCDGCATAGERAERISHDIVGLLGFWLGSTSMDSALRTQCSPAQWKRISEIMGLFLQRHLDLPPAGRNAALDLLAR